MKVLSGIRGLDFSFGLAGPGITTLLAQMGAEIVKVESRRHLDFYRTIVNTETGKPEKIDENYGFNMISLNKRSITLDITKPKGYELTKRLIEMADVMVVGFAPGIAERVGLSYEAVRKIKPDIIMLSTSGSGAKGPEIGYLGYAPLFAALSGIGDTTGYVDGPPTEIRGSMDAACASISAFAVMAALIYRRKTGRGQHIDFASREAMSCLIGDLLMHYTVNGRVLTRNENRDDFMAPHNCYQCQGDDSWISIAIASDREWVAFCHATENPGWAEEERFRDQFSRWRNQEELDRFVQGWAARHTSYEAMEILQKAGVAAVPSFTAPELLCDPHLNEREFFTTADHPKLGTTVVANSPWKLLSTPPEVVRAGPLLGQDNEHVFNGLLGISHDDIEALIKEEVIY